MVEVCVYADISVTGTTFERPEFDRMIQDIRAGKINTVITRDLSRLGRNMWKQVIILREFFFSGCTIYCHHR